MHDGPCRFVPAVSHEVTDPKAPWECDHRSMDFPDRDSGSDPISRSPKAALLEMHCVPHTVRAVTDRVQTAMLVSYTSNEWPERMQPGFAFLMTARLRSKPYSWRAWAEVRVDAACVHDWIGDIAGCDAGHDPSRIQVGRTGWAKVKAAALSAGRVGPAFVKQRAREPWAVVDFTCVDAGRERIVTGGHAREHRNKVEAVLAEPRRSAKSSVRQ